MAKIVSMIAKIKCDQELSQEKYNISPGGYEFKFGDKSIRFDFQDFWGYISNDDPTLLTIDHAVMDTESFPEASKITTDIANNVTSIEEFYIDIQTKNGSDDIKDIQLLFAYFLDEDGNMYHVPQDVIDNTKISFYCGPEE